MANITDSAIQRAIREAERTRRQVSLTDGAGRGTGRLRLIVRPMGAGSLAE